MFNPDRIKEVVEYKSDAIWSVADIFYSSYKNDFPRAIIVAQKYGSPLTNEDYSEEIYHYILVDVTTSVNEKINCLQQLLDQHGIRNYVPPATQTDEIALVAPFSFKYAAVLSGLGWIGKNGVLVTGKFGPRIRLGAILLNYPLKFGKPVTKSSCGNCNACVDACPWQAIKGVNWTISSKRADLLDYQLCNKKHSEYLASNGRKHACGRCILACPRGKDAQ
jgi:epoxyqueuosine reductase